MDVLDERIINLLSALLGGGLFALLNGVFGIIANRKKTGAEAGKTEAEADKIQADISASYQNQIVALLAQSLTNYQALEKERKEKKENDDVLWGKIRSRDEEIRVLKQNVITLIEEKEKETIKNTHIIEAQGSALIEMNTHLLDIKKDTGNLLNSSPSATSE